MHADAGSVAAFSRVLDLVDRARDRLGLTHHEPHGSISIVEPERTQRYTPSRFLDGQFDKIIAFEERTTHTIEHNRHFGGLGLKPPLTACRLRNVILSTGRILTWNSTIRIAPYTGYAFPSAPERFLQLGTAAFCSTMLGLEYFGHWISDDCPLFQLASDFGDPVGFPLNPWPHAAFYKDHFDVRPRSADLVFAREFFLFDDYGFGTSKIKRLHEMRSKISRQFEKQSPENVVYLSRGSTGNPRCMIDEKSWIEQLRLRGVQILRVDNDSADTIFKTIQSARVLITLEGSHGAHALCALQEGSSLLELVPPERFCTRHKEWADAVGIQYGFVVGDKREQGFDFRLDDLLRTIDLML